MENITRRVALGSLLALNLAACSSRSENTAPSTPASKKAPIVPTAKAVTGAGFIDGSSFLTREIQMLPKSLLQELLETRTSHIFRDITSKVVGYSGTTVDISSPRVTIFPRNETQMLGTLQLEAVTNQDLMRTITTDIVARTPYPFLVLEEELKEAPTAIAPDGKTITLQVSYNRGSRLQSGIGPVIGLNLPRQEVDKMISQQSYDPEISFVFIKEAASYLAVDLYMDEVVKGIKAWKYPVSVPSVDSKGIPSVLELPSAHIRNFWRGDGRFMAAIDLAGYIMAIHALKGSPIIDAVLTKHPGERSKFENVLSKPSGLNSTEIIRNACSLVMTNSKVRELYHLGNVDLVP